MRSLTMSFFTLILIFIHLVSLISPSLQFNHSVGPLAICSQSMEDARSYVENCYRRCTRDKGPSSHGVISLYQDVSQTGGPTVTRCAKVRITQTFTETWSFSQIAGAPSRQYMSVSMDECKKGQATSCPRNNCRVKSPASLEPEYHYASDTTVVKDFIEIISLPSGLDFLEREPRITPAMSSKTFPVKDGSGADTNYVYVWDKNYDAKSCPFAVAQNHGCDMYGNPSDLINCRRSRFVIPSISQSKDLSGACLGIKRSVTGLLYSWDEKSVAGNLNNKRLILSPIVNAGTAQETLRTEVAESINAIDEDMCQMQCEMMDMMLRLDRHREVLTRVGGSYVVLSKSGYVRKCHPAIGCKLVKPHQFCGSPNRVAVTCQGVIRFWDPLKSFLDEETRCDKHVRDSKLVFTLGSHEYNIDDGLKVELPDKDEFGIAHDLVARANDGISKELDDPNELRQSWSTHVKEEAGVLNEPLSVEKNVSHWDVNLRLSINWFSGISRVMSDIYSRVSFWLALILTAVIIYLATRSWKNMRYTSYRSPNTPSSGRISDQRATWL
ncbi:TPA_asm: G [Artemisia alphacytorhabdovirus 1]|nr:TPA_asm: G [Artemisia alphacytorhabdovirus 1]